MATLTVVLWAVALTLWAVVAPDSFKGPWVLPAAAALSVLSGVAVGYVPLIRGFIQRPRDELERLEAEEEADQEALRQAGEQPATGPAGLLDPRRGLVSFAGRETELAELLAWCEDDTPLGVRLVTGPGGVGKTRLAVELRARLDPELWRCMPVGDRDEASALEIARRGWPGRVLLLVDYAETRMGLSVLLRLVAADPGRVRLLLLARSKGEWWERLAAGEPAVRELLAAAGGDEPLAEAVSGDLSNVDLVQAAVPAFARALGVEAPSRVDVEVGTEAVRVLDLHAAALVAVLRSPGVEGSVLVSVAEMLDELLGHEERFWQGTAQHLGLLGGTTGMGAVTLRQIVSAGTLLGARSQDQAVELLRRVPGAVVSVNVARWLRDLYPPERSTSEGDSDSREWLGSLHPDRLAERLVVRQLAGSAELAERCLSELDEWQALRAVTVLGRAAADEQEAARELLTHVLPFLQDVVGGLPADAEFLTAIFLAIPFSSDALAEPYLAITRRMLEVIPPGDRWRRALWLNSLGIALDHTGDLAGALSAVQEAVEILREIDEAFPDQYKFELARTLANLSNRFGRLGQGPEALREVQAAVTLYRELDITSPGQYRFYLAGTLANLSTLLSGSGRPDLALPEVEEAVRIFRALDEASPGTHRFALAGALSNIAGTLRDLGRLNEALPLAQEAKTLLDKLAAASPDRYRANLALVAEGLGILFSESNRPAEAVTSAQEAVDIFRDLAASDPGRYQDRWAASLMALAIVFDRSGQPAEADAVRRQASGIAEGRS